MHWLSPPRRAGPACSVKAVISISMVVHLRAFAGARSLGRSDYQKQSEKLLIPMANIDPSIDWLCDCGNWNWLRPPRRHRLCTSFASLQSYRRASQEQAERVQPLQGPEEGVTSWTE